MMDRLHVSAIRTGANGNHPAGSLWQNGADPHFAGETARATFSDRQVENIGGADFSLPGLLPQATCPNYAKYDASKANPYSNIPDPRATKTGTRVTRPKMWRDQRSPLPTPNWLTFITFASRYFERPTS